MVKILIVEDSATAAHTLTKALAPLGHTVSVVGDGANAQRAMKLDRPDLLILDIIMPKINGFELCRNIRADPRMKDIPIIMVTAMDRESDRFWGLKQGANEYLVKPVDPQTLQDKVRLHLSS